ncbi:MAG: STAS domain-containing protein [Gammaproteobacteria bacterium]|jgi:phospholipid transport system transporter-binding protein
MSIRLEQVGPGQSRLVGALSFETVPEFWRQFDAAGLFEGGGDAALQVDLSGVTRADSAGIALLLALMREARGAGRQLVFAGLPDQLARMIEVSDLESVIPRQIA